MTAGVFRRIIRRSEQSPDVGASCWLGCELVVQKLWNIVGTSPVLKADPFLGSTNVDIAAVIATTQYLHSCEVDARMVKSLPFEPC